MIPINPVDDAHAALVIGALNAVLQTGFIGGERDGWGSGINSYGTGDGNGDGYGYGSGDGGNNSVSVPPRWLLS